MMDSDYIKSGLMLVGNTRHRVERVKILAPYRNFRRGFRGNYFETQFDFQFTGNSGDCWQIPPKPSLVKDVYGYLTQSLKAVSPLFHLATPKEILHFQASLSDGRVNIDGSAIRRHFAEYQSMFGFEIYQLHSHLPKNLSVKLGLQL